MTMIKLFGRRYQLVKEPGEEWCFRVTDLLGNTLLESEFSESRKECQAEGLRVASQMAMDDLEEKRVELYKWKPGEEFSFRKALFAVQPVVSVQVTRLS